MRDDSGNGTRFFAEGPAEDVVAIAAAAGIDRVAVAIVNPPRRGLTLAALEGVLALEPRRLLYVSCEPRTLARDLARLAERSFGVKRVRAFDMLPQTPHVEAVALLERDAGTGSSSVPSPDEA